MSKGALKNIKIYGGLQPTPEDKRDIRFGALYALPELVELPPAFRLPVMGIKDQKDSDLCAAFAGTLASEIQEDTVFSPEYQFAKTKQIIGEYEEWGADLRSMLKSLVKYGSLPLEKVPPELRYNGKNRNAIANWANWSPLYDMIAAKFKKGSYLKVSGEYDLFDNIRATIYANRKEERLVITGAVWKHDWTTSRDGIVEDKPLRSGQGFGHAFCISGWEYFRGSPHLVAVLSNGESVGRDGYYFLPRGLVNRELVWGAYTIRDINPEAAKMLVKYGFSARFEWLANFVMAIKTIFNFNVR